MEIKVINHKDKGKTEYKVYSIDEAIGLGIQFKEWYDAEVGEYGCSSDGLVSKLISKKFYNVGNKSQSTYFTYPVGSVFKSARYKFKKFNAKKIRGAYLTGSRTRAEKRFNTDVGRRMAAMYALIPDSDIVIDKVLGPHSESRHGMWKRHFKMEGFKQMVREELQALLKDKGFGEAETLDLLQETIDLCKTKKDTSTLMRAVTELLDMHGMKNKDKIKTTEMIEGTQTVRMIDDINREEANYVKLERVIENDNLGTTTRDRTEEDRS